jgi:hypothetical protein
LFDRMREGSTLGLNAVSLVPAIGPGLLGLLGIVAQRNPEKS